MQMPQDMVLRLSRFGDALREAKYSGAGNFV